MADKSLDKGKNLDDTSLWDHKWGFTDTKFVTNPDFTTSVTGERYAISGTTMPGFLPFVEEMLDVKIDINDIKPELTLEEKPATPPNIDANFQKALEEAFPATQYSTEKRDRLLRSHGQTTVDEVYQVLYNKLDRLVDLVFWPESDEDATKIVQLAEKHDICLVPFGGGTSVSSALILPSVEEEPRTIVAVDTRRMNKILWLDETNLLAEVQAGITGKQLEDTLEEKGYTCGHEPDSLELSTLGGWIATNASGMKKNRYGNIEDIVENVTMVTTKGIVEHKVAMPRVSIGIQPKNLLFGSEGNLGLITKAIIRIHPIPEVKKYGSLVFPTFKQGIDFMFALTRTGVYPASIRLLDNIQFRFGSALKPIPTASEEMMDKIQKFALLKIKGFDPDELCAATIVMEGTKEEVAYQEKVIFPLAGKFGGISGGEGNGKRGYMLTYAIAYIRDYLADYYMIGETYETTVPWSKVNDVLEAVAKRAVEKHNEHGLPGRPYVSPRITQLYHTGVCIYFTHGFCIKGIEHPDKVFADIEHEMRVTIMNAGGSISHHHGVGKLRKEFMSQTISPTSIEILKGVKQAHDPNNVFGIRNNVFSE